MSNEILNFIKQQLSLIIGIIIGAVASPILKKLFALTKYFIVLRDLKRLEKTYSSSLKFAKGNLKELGLIVNKLPEEIVIETAYKDDMVLFSRIRAFFKKNVIGKLRGKEIFSITIFGNMSYEEQVAFIIQKSFESIISAKYEKVLGIDFRESLVIYYSYKLAFLSEDLVGKGVTLILERKFNEAKFKEIILKLDSKELEESITLNPPPEVRPLLDRVIMPIIELKSQEISPINDLSTIELTRREMQQLLTKIAEGKIGILFIGSRTPEEYLQYIKSRIDEFEGVLICARGKRTILCDPIVREISKEYQGSLGIETPSVKTFEGTLPSEENRPLNYKYVLISKHA
jgi:hypothetical protein